jgi:hypothetical protein
MWLALLLEYPWYKACPHIVLRKKQQRSSDRILRSNATKQWQFVVGVLSMTQVLINEYWDESMVLLRRRMCWQLNDVLYFSLKGSADPTTLSNPRGAGAGPAAGTLLTSNMSVASMPPPEVPSAQHLAPQRPAQQSGSSGIVSMLSASARASLENLLHVDIAL